MSGWWEDIPKKASLESRLKFYLKHSYYKGYDLNRYFTEENQITMFERLLECDEEFKQQWESGSYCQPVDPTYTERMAEYETIQSPIKQFYRQICPYRINKKLTEGAKNLLKGYMIKYSQNDDVDDDKLAQIFCGILKQANKRREKYISQIEDKLPDDIVREMRGFLGPSGGKKSKSRFKRKTIVNKNKTNKRKYNKRKYNKRRTLKIYNY